MPQDWIKNRKRQSSDPALRRCRSRAAAVHSLCRRSGKPRQEAKEVLNVLMSADALGRPLVVSKQVPADRLGQSAHGLRRHDKRMPQFLAETEKLDLPVVGTRPGPEAEQIVASIYAASPRGDCSCPSHRRQIGVRYGR